MAKKIITFNEVIELNHILEENELKFKVHLHDTCGNQSFNVEPLSNCACEGRYEEMNQVITKYFNEKTIKIRFLDNQLDFLITE